MRIERKRCQRELPESKNLDDTTLTYLLSLLHTSHISELDNLSSILTSGELVRGRSEFKRSRLFHDQNGDGSESWSRSDTSVSCSPVRLTREDVAGSPRNFSVPPIVLQKIGQAFHPPPPSAFPISALSTITWIGVPAAAGAERRVALSVDEGEDEEVAEAEEVVALKEEVEALVGRGEARRRSSRIRTALVRSRFRLRRRRALI